MHEEYFCNPLCLRGSISIEMCFPDQSQSDYSLLSWVNIPRRGKIMQFYFLSGKKSRSCMVVLIWKHHDDFIILFFLLCMDRYMLIKQYKWFWEYQSCPLWSHRKHWHIFAPENIVVYSGFQSTSCCIWMQSVSLLLIHLLLCLSFFD